jgi:hypothetical protein
MAIVVTKLKVLKEIEQDLSEGQSLFALPIEDLVDKYGELKEAVDRILSNPILAEFEKLQKDLKERLNNELEVTDEAEVVGEVYAMEVSACSKSPRKLDQNKMPEIEKALTREVFLKLAKLTMKDLEQYLGKAMIEKFLDKETTYTDTRKLTIKKI